MAKLSLNSALRRVSGHIDGYVYKTINGRSFITKKPVFENRRWSRDQKAGHQRMKAAARYANDVWQDPERKAFYVALAKKRKAWRAYSLASGDYLNPPEIEAINVVDTKAGRQVHVYAQDDVGVIRVTVSLRTAKGRVLAAGEAAVEHDGRWMYAPPAWPQEPEFEIEVTAEDRAGNRAVKVAGVEKDSIGRD